MMCSQADAQAVAEPATVVESLTHAPTDSEIYAWVEKGGLPSGRQPVTPSSAVVDVVDDLWRSEHGPIPNQVASDALHAELNAFRTYAKLLPKLGGGWGVGLLTKANLVATAAFTGWQIGTALRSIYVSSELPAQSGAYGPSTPPITGVRYFDKGDVIDPISQPVVRYARYNGFAGTYDYYGRVGYTTFGPNLAAFPSQARAGFEMQVSLNPDGLYYFRAGQLTVDDQLASGVTQVGSRIDWPTGTQGTNGESATTTKQRVADDLQDHPDRYPTLLPWLDAHLSGDSDDPTGQLIKTPACSGDTYTACRTKLQAAGFTGTITQHTLSSDDAVMEEQADTPHGWRSSRCRPGRARRISRP